MVWYLIQKRDNFTFTSAIYLQNYYSLTSPPLDTIIIIIIIIIIIAFHFFPTWIFSSRMLI
jgi:hypothetical protein